MATIAHSMNTRKCGAHIKIPGTENAKRASEWASEQKYIEEANARARAHVAYKTIEHAQQQPA